MLRGREIEEDSYPLHMTGCATTLPAEEERDVVAELYEIVAEVTGKPTQEKGQKRRIGFLD